jgi:hypothetical protein
VVQADSIRLVNVVLVAEDVLSVIFRWAHVH